MSARSAQIPNHQIPRFVPLIDELRAAHIVRFTHYPTNVFRVAMENPAASQRRLSCKTTTTMTTKQWIFAHHAQRRRVC